MAQTLNRTKWAKPQSKQAASSPTVADLAWAAGFLEGEGNFYANTRANKHVSHGVRAVQKFAEPLYKLQAMFGGSVSLTHKAGPKYPNAYPEWRVYGARARGVMLTLFSFLSSRRRGQVRVALSGGY